MIDSVNDLQISSVRADDEVMLEVLALYRDAFPEHERIPEINFLEGVERHVAICRAYLMSGSLVAFTYVLNSDKLDYLFFFAVKSSFRSQGIGSCILKTLLAESERPLLVTIEPVEVTVDNLDQRQRRLAFYERHGFKATNWYYQEGDETYHLLTTRILDDYTILLIMVDEVLKGKVPLHLKHQVDDKT